MCNFRFRVIIIFFIISSLFLINSNLKATDINWDVIKTTSQQLLEKEPDNIMANFRLAIAMANLGEVKESYKLIKELTQEISKKEFNSAIIPYLALLKDNQDDILLLNYAAFSAVINDDYKSGINYFKQILRLTPQNVWIYNYQAACHIELKQYNEAKKILGQAIKIQDNQYSHFLLGTIYYQKGNLIKALKEFARSGDILKELFFNF